MTNHNFYLYLFLFFFNAVEIKLIASLFTLRTRNYMKGITNRLKGAITITCSDCCTTKQGQLTAHTPPFLHQRPAHKLYTVGPVTTSYTAHTTRQLHKKHHHEALRVTGRMLNCRTIITILCFPVSHTGRKSLMHVDIKTLH